MNERIKILLEQSRTKDYWSEGYYLVDFVNQEKFAKLIVRECIEQIRSQSMDSGDEWENGLHMAEYAIREHFVDSTMTEQGTK